jgi:arylsulfatase A-like enzyme
MPERPNVLFVVTDKLRADAVGADPQTPTDDGHPVVETPNVDHFAREGATFTRAYSPSPTCVPGRRCLWTGKTPASSDSTAWVTDPWEFDHTPPGELTRAGYQTHLVGKTHARPPRNHFGFERVELHEGNSFWDGTGEKDDYQSWLDRQTDGEIDEQTSGMVRNTVDARPFPFDEQLHPTVWTTDRGLEFIDRCDPTRPFFLTLSYVRPHPPLDPPQQYWDMYIDRDLPDPAVGDWVDNLYGDVRPSYLGTRVVESDDVPYGLVPEEGGESTPNAWCAELPERTAHRVRAAYYGLITQLDHQLRRITRRLQVLGELENTIIVFTSDHGTMLGDHHLWYMSYGYEGSARVPLVMKFPDGIDAPRGRRIDRPVGLEDIMPTLLEVAGASVPETVDGRSLLRLLDDSDREDWRTWYHGEHGPAYHPTNATQFLVNETTKYIWNPITGDELLFDLESDPRETEDLSADPDCRSTLEQCRETLIDRLEGRPEGFTDGETLQPGGDR